MSLEQFFSNWQIPIIAATISILLGGILFGIGLGFGIKRIRIAGQEEIFQGIISAAMAGGIITFSLFIESIASSTLPPAFPPCPSFAGQNSTNSFYLCNLEALSNAYLYLGDYLSTSSNILGFISSVKISFDSVSAQPFFALESFSSFLFTLSSYSYLIHSLAFMELQLFDAINKSAILVLLPAGILLRTFFATRKLGAACMALSVSFYLFYPLFFLFVFSTSKSLEFANKAQSESRDFNLLYASIPLTNLDQTSAVKEKINQLSENDFEAKIHPIFSLSTKAIFLSLPDLIFYPVISIVLCFVAAFQLYKLFSLSLFSYSNLI